MVPQENINQFFITKTEREQYEKFILSILDLYTADCSFEKRNLIEYNVFCSLTSE